jgi:hypothetical protein
MIAVMAVDIRNLSPQAPDPSAERRVLTPPFSQRVHDRLVETVTPIIARLQGLTAEGALHRASAALEAFSDLYDQRPVRDNSGGSGFNDILWLFLLVRALAPAWIVESGVHKGHSTWIMRQACPDAEIFCFDITLSNLQYRDENAQYFEGDWRDWEISQGLDPAHGLIFFDDHIDQARRLVEAADRWFRTALFDDNFAAEHLYATGGPPVPTLAMVTDPDLAAVPAIEWTRSGKLYRYVVDQAALAEARSLIEHYEVMPDLAQITRFPLGSGMTIVAIRSSGTSRAPR